MAIYFRTYMVSDQEQLYQINLQLSKMSQRLTTPEEYASLIDNFDTYLFDCDGVIWQGPRLIPGVMEVMKIDK